MLVKFGTSAARADCFPRYSRYLEETLEESRKEAWGFETKLIARSATLYSSLDNMCRTVQQHSTGLLL